MRFYQIEVERQFPFFVNPINISMFAIFRQYDFFKKYVNSKKNMTKVPVLNRYTVDPLNSGIHNISHSQKVAI